jgi:hypothetical protein
MTFVHAAPRLPRLCDAEVFVFGEGIGEVLRRGMCDRLGEVWSVWFSSKSMLGRRWRFWE